MSDDDSGRRNSTHILVHKPMASGDPFQMFWWKSGRLPRVGLNGDFGTQAAEQARVCHPVFGAHAWRLRELRMFPQPPSPKPPDVRGIGGALLPILEGNK